MLGNDERFRMREYPPLDMNDETTKAAMLATMQQIVALPAGTTPTAFLDAVRSLHDAYGPKAVLHCIVSTVLMQKAIIKGAEEHLDAALKSLRTFRS